MKSGQITVREEVSSGLRAGSPIVALESTIIAHGMPYPKNLETAFEVEQIIRDCGAIPATIGIVDGVITCGLSQDQIELFAVNTEIKKATERDIPMIVSRGWSAATTVGASLAIASSLGIYTFVTGGIGGVGAEAGKTFDISADLPAIAEYPCIIVSSGTKAFMDVPATLEYMETHRVPVIGYQTDYFPLFWSASSGIPVEWSARGADEIAEAFSRKLDLDHGGGFFVGVPLPEEDALPADETRRLVASAIGRVKALGIVGKAVTPKLLSLIGEESGERSLKANIALIKHNAQVGAEIAVALARKMKE